jgi:hypothetical protein
VIELAPAGKAKRMAVVNAPSDPALARLWSAALSKFEARTGRAATLREDVREVVRDYQRMLAKPRGSVNEIVAYLQERCAPQTPGG